MRHLKRYNQLFESQQELTQEQKDWLDECSYGKWSVNPKTGLVDVRGSFDCRHQGLIDFKGVRFGSVSGHFDCSNNSLTSLEGAPQSVGWGFYCSNNSLTSLEGAPQKVGEGFFCSENVISEKAIERVLKRMSNNSIPLEQAVSDLWDVIPDVDKIYLSKHHPDLSPEEKKGYQALERFKKKVI